MPDFIKGDKDFESIPTVKVPVINFKFIVFCFLKLSKVKSYDVQIAFACSNMKWCFTAVVFCHDVALIFIHEMFKYLKLILFSTNMKNSFTSVFEDNIFMKLLVHDKFILELLQSTS